MGQTRVIYSDATTAEAASVLKSCGFLESSQGGLFTNTAVAVKVYVVWGKGDYYPDISARLDFTPRIQIHLKSKLNGPDLAEVTQGTVTGLRAIAPETRLRVYDANLRQELPI